MPLVITQPVQNMRFSIDATPRMPVIVCQVQISGAQPVSTTNTTFNWTFQITEAIQAGTCPSARIQPCVSIATEQNVRGLTWTPRFTSIQGGTAVITVAATISGVQHSASVTVLIRGTNPTATAVTQRIGGANTTGDRIACHESSRRQFDATGMPLLGPGGDVGVMQLCNPAATCGQRWNWLANVDQGMVLLATKESEARNYLDGHRIAGQYPNNLGLGNDAVLQRETIQRYNGGRYWTWTAAANQWQATPANGYVATVLACQ